MLYIWPFFAFFSIPLLLPYVTSFIFMVLSGSRSEPSKSLPASASSNKDAADSAATGLQISLSSKRRGSRKHNNDAQDRTAHDSARPDHRYSPLLRSLLVLCQTKSTIWLIYILATILVSVAIVKFNTIIHPFTLADNRHYMFYVFRYTIRRSSWIRYALVMIYSVSRWMVWGTLRGCSTWLFEITGDDCSTNFSYSPLPPNSYASHPFTYNAGRPQSKAPFAGSTVAAESEEIRKEKQEQVDRALREDPLLYSTEPVSTSAALVFLLATSLSLITAPLVEPRYFIIPWVIWRLLIPSWRVHDHRPGSEIEKIQGSGTLLGKLLSFFKHYDSRLILETVWFVAINIGTMCIFLFKPYQWRAEDGTLLDNGRWQRFMW
jgi:alpha-1,2-glucosyltransferase